MKPDTPPLQAIRLLDQLRERVQYMHYSLSTEKIYLYWVRFFIHWHGRNGQMKHPRTMGALLFLYREVLNLDLPWVDGINRPASKCRIPSVLVRDEVVGVLVPAMRMR